MARTCSRRSFRSAPSDGGPSSALLPPDVSPPEKVGSWAGSEMSVEDGWEAQYGAGRRKGAEGEAVLVSLGGIRQEVKEVRTELESALSTLHLLPPRTPSSAVPQTHPTLLTLISTLPQLHSQLTQTHSRLALLYKQAQVEERKEVDEVEVEVKALREEWSACLDWVEKRAGREKRKGRAKESGEVGWDQLAEHEAGTRAARWALEHPFTQLLQAFERSQVNSARLTPKKVNFASVTSEGALTKPAEGVLATLWDAIQRGGHPPPAKAGQYQRRRAEIFFGPPPTHAACVELSPAHARRRRVKNGLLSEGKTSSSKNSQDSSSDSDTALLNAGFIELPERVPTDDPNAVESEDELMEDAKHKIKMQHVYVPLVIVFWLGIAGMVIYYCIAKIALGDTAALGSVDLDGLFGINAKNSSAVSGMSSTLMSATTTSLQGMESGLVATTTSVERSATSAAAVATAAATGEWRVRRRA